MKKRVVSILCTAAFAAVVAFGCVGAETAEASQQGAADVQQEETEGEVEFYGPYELETSGGLTSLGYYVYNDTEENVYVSMTVNCMDGSYENVGTLSAYIPCIGPGEEAYLYVVDYYELGADGQYLTLYFSGPSDFTSATDDLEQGLDLDYGDSYVSFSAYNYTSETIWVPQITVLYFLDDAAVYVASGPISESGTNRLDEGSIGYIDVDAPMDYDSGAYFLNALYNRPASGSDGAAVSDAEDYAYSGDDYFRGSDIDLTDPSRIIGEDDGQN